MTLLQIITPPNPILRQKNKPVHRLTPEIHALIDDMIETMRESKGVGLAAPQVGVNIQLAVIESLPEVDEEGNDIPDSRKLFIIINPKLSWHSRQLSPGIEGCLSIPGYLGEVERYDAIRAQWLNRAGKKVNMRFKGWTARIFQHEIDHLNGVLYTDRLTSPDNFWTEEEFEAMQEEAQRRAEEEEAKEAAQVES